MAKALEQLEDDVRWFALQSQYLASVGQHQDAARYRDLCRAADQLAAEAAAVEALHLGGAVDEVIARAAARKTALEGDHGQGAIGEGAASTSGRDMEAVRRVRATGEGAVRTERPRLPEVRGGTEQGQGAVTP